MYEYIHILNKHIYIYIYTQVHEFTYKNKNTEIEIKTDIKAIGVKLDKHVTLHNQKLSTIKQSIHCYNN